MTQQELIFAEVPIEKLTLLTHQELICLFKGEQSLRLQLQRDNERLRALNEELKQKSLVIEEQLVTVKNKLFGRSSEKSPKTNSESGQDKKAKKKKVLLPSE